MDDMGSGVRDLVGAASPTGITGTPVAAYSSPAPQSPPPAPAAPDVFQQATQMYPYLADKGISFFNDINPADSRMLESWMPGVDGWDWQGERFNRPQQLPLGSFGIQNRSENTRPIDILGDYVSHQAINTDPFLSKKYQEFASSIDPSNMQERYQYHKDHLNESREYKDWVNETGIPEYFRGYTFNQWDNAKDFYRPDQLKVLDEIRAYLGIK